MQRAIVLCQGEQYRLAQLGHPKHLLSVGNETILGRTLRLLHAAGWPAVVIGGPMLAQETSDGGSRLYTLSEPGYCVLDAIAQLGDFFQDADVRVFLGDVVWSRPAFDSFLQGGSGSESLFFAGTPGIDYGQGELFGMGFSRMGRSWMERLVRDAPCRKILPDRGQPGHLRNLLFAASSIYELPPRMLYSDELFIPVDDWTCDIDKPEDLDRLPYLAEQIAREA